MTYTVTFTVRRQGQPRTITTNFGGCTDEQDAVAKVRACYDDVIKVQKVALKKEK